MSRATRCPRCSTLFRVTAEQLEARAGKVRCGRCLCVFDAVQAMEGAPVQAATASLQTAVRSAAPSAPSSADEPPSQARTTHLTTEHRERALVPSADDSARARRLSARGRPAQWVLASLALALALLFQFAYVWRSDLLARFPATEPVFAAVCALAGCTVALPQKPELVRIEASDLHTLDPARPELIQLTATLRSYADHEVAYPALDLVLTNAYEHPLARRIFLPREYLGASADLTAGIAPRAELTIALELDIGRVEAAGFRIGLLAAPAL